MPTGFSAHSSHRFFLDEDPSHGQCRSCDLAIPDERLREPCRKRFSAERIYASDLKWLNVWLRHYMPDHIDPTVWVDRGNPIGGLSHPQNFGAEVTRPCFPTNGECPCDAEIRKSWWLPLELVAAALQRTPAAVVERAAALGLSQPHKALSMIGSVSQEFQDANGQWVWRRVFMGDELIHQLGWPAGGMTAAKLAEGVGKPKQTIARWVSEVEGTNPSNPDKRPAFWEECVPIPFKATDLRRWPLWHGREQVVSNKTETTNLKLSGALAGDALVLRGPKRTTNKDEASQGRNVALPLLTVWRVLCLVAAEKKQAESRQRATQCPGCMRNARNLVVARVPSLSVPDKWIEVVCRACRKKSRTSDQTT